MMRRKIIDRIIDGLARSQNNYKMLRCQHEYEALFAHPVTLEVLERRCKKCGKRQRSEVVWHDI